MTYSRAKQRTDSRMEMATRERMGRLLRSQRLHAGFSVFELARELDVDACVIRSWERGSIWPSVPALVRFAMACKVSLHEVLP